MIKIKVFLFDVFSYEYLKGALHSTDNRIISVWFAKTMNKLSTHQIWLQSIRYSICYGHLIDPTW